MIVGATGIVIDHYGDVLMIQRDDTRTLAPPGGSSEIGELPFETAVREVKEETGLLVMPVRLVGLYYTPTKPDDYLSFCYRCILRGGDIKTSEEALQAGFFKTNPLPTPILKPHRERIDNSLNHQGGAPIMSTHHLPFRYRIGTILLHHVVYPWLHFRRRRSGLPAYQPPPHWKIHVSVIIQDEQGRILWVKSTGDAEWELPGTVSFSNEPPWETAGRLFKNIKIDFRLSGIYPVENMAMMALIFFGRCNSGQLAPMGNALTTLVPFGHDPQAADPQHILWVADALDSVETIPTRLLPAGSNL